MAEHDPAERALRHHLSDRAALVVGDARVDGRRCQQDARVGLVGRTDRDPAHLAFSDVVANLESEHVAVEGEGSLWIVVRQDAGVDRDVMVIVGEASRGY